MCFTSSICICRNPGDSISIKKFNVKNSNSGIVLAKELEFFSVFTKITCTSYSAPSPASRSAASAGPSHPAARFSAAPAAPERASE
jgi:hypothetical protein